MYTVHGADEVVKRFCFSQYWWKYCSQVYSDLITAPRIIIMFNLYYGACPFGGDDCIILFPYCVDNVYSPWGWWSG